MGKLAGLIKENVKDFLTLHDAIGIISHFCDDNSKEVGIYLGKTKIFETLPTYEKDKFFNFNSISNNNISELILDHFVSGKDQASIFRPSVIKDTYWKKIDFLEFEPIKKLGITSNVVEHFLNYRYYKSGHDSFTPFKDFVDNTPESISKFRTPITDQQRLARYQRKRDQYKQQTEQQLQAENEVLRQRIAELEAQQRGKIFNQNAINSEEISLPVNDLMLVAALVVMLRNEIRVKANKSQAKILQTIEDNHKHMTGLSKSRTEKILAAANKAYKSLNNKKMK